MHDIHLEKDVEEDKLGIIDVRAIINDRSIVNIDIQLENENNIIPRSTIYGAKLFSNEKLKQYSKNLHLKIEWKKIHSILIYTNSLYLNISMIYYYK